MIVGIDEVGRGAWAGPLCVAAAGLGGVQIDGLTDSKKLSKKKRDHFATLIKQQAPLIGIGWVSAAHIDKIGMSEALKLASQRAFTQIDTPAVTQIIIDGTIMLLDDPRASTMKQADLLVPSVSAASIVAKVARDTYMEQISQVFPDHKFAGHVGYGTAAHHQMIDDFGTTPIHRMSFAPMKTMDIIKKPVVTTDGANAEQAASLYLEGKGYTIIDQNWKTKWCEIDIIAEKSGVVHFVEVKYRKKDAWGNGLEAITMKKLRQMKFAAELWMNSHDYKEALVSTISLSGENYRVDLYIENVL